MTSQIIMGTSWGYVFLTTTSASQVRLLVACQNLSNDPSASRSLEFELVSSLIHDSCGIRMYRSRVRLVAACLICSYTPRGGPPDFPQHTVGCAIWF